nr:TRAP transporter small permease [uncultured Eubacterium sp.]
MKVYSKFLDGLEMAEKVILTATMTIMTAVMAYQVILRYVFSSANAWSEELTRYLFIFNVMVAAAIAIRRNAHLQIDILLSRMSEKTKHIFTIIATLAGMVFLGFLLVSSIRVCGYTVNNISAGLGISMAIPYAAVPVGTVLMLLTSVEVILKEVAALQNKEVKEA